MYWIGRLDRAHRLRRDTYAFTHLLKRMCVAGAPAPGRHIVLPSGRNNYSL